MPFTLQPDDLPRMQRFALQRALPKLAYRRLVFGLRVLVWFCLAFALFRLVEAHDCCVATQPFITQAGFSALAAMVLFAVTQYVWQSSYLRHAVGPGGWFLSEQDVAVTEQGIRHSSRLGPQEVPWSAYLWRAEDERNFYLFIDEGIGFVFPKSAFPKQADQDLIRAQVAGEV